MSSKSSNISILTIIVFIALIGALGFLLMSNSSLKKELKANKQAMLDLEKINTELDQNYELALQDLEDLRGDNQELNDLIEEQKNELTKQKQRISKLIWTERELGKAQSEIEKLTAMAKQYVNEISELKEANAQLMAENEALNNSNKNLSQELRVNKERVSNLDSLRKILAMSNQSLAENNDALSEKVDVAKTIKLNRLEVQGIDKKGNGKLKEKSRAKRIDFLRTCFTTESNLVTEPGAKEFFISFTSPAGELLYVEELGSGYFEDKQTGKKIRFTTSGTVDYKNEESRACIDWNPNFGLSSGTYLVSVFQNGYKVGDTSFKLK